MLRYLNYLSPQWWWQYFETLKQEIIMSAKQDAADLKAVLDAIAGDIGPIKAGIESLQANLAQALSDDANDPDPALLKEALTQANQLKGAFDAIAQGFASAGSPIPETSNPAPVEQQPQPEGAAADPNGEPATGGQPGEETKATE